MHLFNSLKIFALLLAINLLISSCSAKKEDKIIIATSANMQYAMKEMVSIFSDLYHIPCEIVTASSGNLTAQIIQGAPFDIFVAANMKYPKLIFEKGIAHEPARIYAFGKLVLWSMNEEVIPSIEVLQSQNIVNIALPNPKIAPYGIAASEVLKQTKLWDTLEEKFVYGESIAQTNQFIMSKSADIGFTALSVVLSVGKKGQWIEIDESKYEPIAQGALLLKQKGSTKNDALKFYNFLFSEEGKDILKNFGYSVNE